MSWNRQKKEDAAAAHQQFTSKYGDHMTALNLYRAYSEVDRKQRLVWCQEHFVNARSLRKATDIQEQLQQQMLNLNLPVVTSASDVEPVLKALVAGLFTNAAKRQADGELFLFKVDVDCQSILSKCMLVGLHCCQQNCAFG